MKLEKNRSRRTVAVRASIITPGKKGGEKAI